MSPVSPSPFAKVLAFVGNSPVLKTAVAQIIGALAVAADSFVQQSPSGGFATWLGAHPIALPLYVGGAQFAHNLLSKFFPPSPAAASSASK